MKNTTKKLFNKVASLALAAIMVLSVFCVSTPTEVSAADPSFKSTGKSSVTITDEQCTTATGQATWIKFKAKNDGYLKITAKMASTYYTDYVQGYWTLYDKTKKTAVSPKNVYSTNYTDSYYYTDVYGVKKGVTYYLQVLSDGGVTINAAFTKVADKSGAKKAKALTIKKGKTSTGLIRVGDSKVTDWYKFNFSSVKKFTVYVTPYTNDDIVVTVSGSKLVKDYSYTIKSGYYGKKLDFPFTATGKISGTCYVRVKPAKKTTSGYYKISWK